MIESPSPSPNLTMNPQSQTLSLTLIISILLSSVSSISLPPSPNPSPSPSPSGFKAIMSDPIGVLRHPPPLPDIFRRRPPPSCSSDRIDCLESRRGRGRSGAGPPAVNSGNEKLNFGKKIGIVFAVAAVLLQVVLGGFLVYKRRQLRKLDQRGSRLVSSSNSS